MKTILAPPTEENLARAAQFIKQGQLVGMPTETVYGLAADAGNEQAVKAIFTAKGRPQDNPLIVHISSLDMLEKLAESVPETARRLAEAFWPGPLTMILPKSQQVSDTVTAGIGTVAVRFPSHPVAQRLIALSRCPIAAPSANLSGSPSPTRAEHVLRDMVGRIPMILDGGECQVGLESTVVSVSEDLVRVLRPGGITVDDLLTVASRVEVDGAVLHQLEAGRAAASPGMKYKHYAPKAQVTIVEGKLSAFYQYAAAHQESVTYCMVFDGEERNAPLPCITYGSKDDQRAQARELFDCLRRLDDLGAQTVFVRSPSREGVGLAVYNRLLRAAAFRVVSL